MDIKQNIGLDFSSNKRLAYLLIQNWSSSGKLRKTSFLHSLATKGLLRVSDYEIEGETSLNNFGNEIDSIISVLNRMYENNWDFHLRPIFSNGKLSYYRLFVKILFPHTTIVNRDDESHEIRDLIVLFTLKKSDVFNSLTLCPSDIDGTRGFMTFEEWFIGYNHSHLPSLKPGGYSHTFNTSSFCTGSDTEINNTITQINIDGYTEEMFELFLYTLNTLVGYESIEGVPYISMNKVGPVNENTHTPTMNPHRNSLANSYKLILPFMNFTSSLKYHFNDNRFRIKLNSEFDDFVKYSIQQSGNMDQIKNYIIRKINNNYYGFTIPVVEINVENVLDTFRNTNGELPFTMIQGKKITFHITDYAGELPEIKNYKTHPKLLEYVAEQLEQQLYYKAVRKSTVERQYQGNNA